MRMQILITERHRKMLEWMAERSQRSMSSMLRIVIERAYEATKLQEAAGIAKGIGRADGKD